MGRKMSTRISMREQPEFEWGIDVQSAEPTHIPIPHKQLIESDYRFQLVHRDVWQAWVKPIIDAYSPQPVIPRSNQAQLAWDTWLEPATPIHQPNPIFQKTITATQNSDPHQLYMLLLTKKLGVADVLARDGTDCICVDEQAFFSLVNWIAVAAEIAATEHKDKPEAKPFEPVIKAINEVRQNKTRHEAWRRDQIAQQVAADKRGRIVRRVLYAAAAFIVAAGLILYNLHANKIPGQNSGIVKPPPKKQRNSKEIKPAENMDRSQGKDKQTSSSNRDQNFTMVDFAHNRPLGMGFVAAINAANSFIRRR